MKKIHIIAIIIIAVAIGAIVTSIADSSTYANFDEAFSNPGQEYHVVGTLDRTSQVVYRPEQNPNLTRFVMVDNTGEKQEVFLHKSKPQDFERSESVVLIGEAHNGEFHANEVLMKCPSKYEEGSKMRVSESSSNAAL